MHRRAFIQGMALFAAAGPARAQGFAGLGGEAEGYAPVVRGRALTFPADHGAHPQFRIEWWYVTANLRGEDGETYGAQWTLFRQAMAPGVEGQGWESRQLWMGHAAVTGARQHLFAERLARGGVGQAGVKAAPFHAFIDAWELRALEDASAQTLAPLALVASSTDYRIDLRLDAARPVVLQGEGGYSEKSTRGQASYYYSQPFFTARGEIVLAGRRVAVTGQAWLDREWSSQPLAPDQKGWDWMSLHLASGDKVMLFRLRQDDGADYRSGNWIDADGTAHALAASDIAMTPTAWTTIGAHVVPTSWTVAIASRRLTISITPLNAQSWMGTSIPYWEGPVRIEGSDSGVGYLEATGY
jgi:predicted secreted hydrolase